MPHAGDSSRFGLVAFVLLAGLGLELAKLIINKQKALRFTVSTTLTHSDGPAFYLTM